GRHDEALAAFDATVAANPRAAQPHRARAKVLEILGRPDDARAALARADELEPPPGP
ncbi:MAG: tetratricopeptide repeat protein, partial [Pseudolabrys sp.]|nr:tetratricopeptide repeat protein [Pseudolabrys sp.]